MNFELDDGQRLLQDSVHRLLRDKYSLSQRRNYLTHDLGYDTEMWNEYSRMGLTALLIPESHGGLGATPSDLFAVQREMGRALIQEPYLSSSVLSSVVIRAADDMFKDEAILAQLATGSITAAFAHVESEERRGAGTLETQAVQAGPDYVLSGRKQLVRHAAGASHLVVSANTPNGRPSWFLVNNDAAGISMRQYRLIDGTNAADITFQNAIGRPLCHPERYAEILHSAHAFGIAAICAEATGAAEAAFEMTVEYVKTRVQFGRPIGSNQAIRHRIADMAAALDSCLSMAMLAAIAVEHPGSTEPHDLSHAKVLVGRQGRYVCEQAIQLHGGIGMTDEYGVGHYLKRLLVLDQLLGDVDHHLDPVADAG